MKTMLLILAVAALASPTIAADLCEGAFKINLAKSKFNPGPPPKSRTIRYQRSGDRCGRIVDGEDASGVMSHREFGGGSLSQHGIREGIPDPGFRPSVCDSDHNEN
jgi:hypothetical protein